MSRPRGNKSSAALIEARRTRLLQLKQENKTTLEAEEILTAEGFPADRVTLWRDLKEMMVKLESNNSESYMQLKQEQDTILRRMEEFLLTEQVDPEVAREWRAIRKDISELWGLDAATKSIHANVSGPQLDALYLDIRAELLDLNDGDKQDALLMMREFAKSRKKPVVVDAMPLQPVERRLTDGNIL